MLIANFLVQVDVTIRYDDVGESPPHLPIAVMMQFD